MQTCPRQQRRPFGHSRRSRDFAPWLAPGRDRHGQAGRRREGRTARSRDPAARRHRAVGRHAAVWAIPKFTGSSSATDDRCSNTLPGELISSSCGCNEIRCDRHSSRSLSKEARRQVEGRWRAGSAPGGHGRSQPDLGSTGATINAWCRWRARIEPPLKRIGRKAPARPTEPGDHRPGNRFEFPKTRRQGCRRPGPARWRGLTSRRPRRPGPARHGLRLRRTVRGEGAACRGPL